MEGPVGGRRRDEQTSKSQREESKKTKRKWSDSKGFLPSLVSTTATSTTASCRLSQIESDSAEGESSVARNQNALNSSGGGGSSSGYTSQLSSAPGSSNQQQQQRVDQSREDTKNMPSYVMQNGGDRNNNNNNSSLAGSNNTKYNKQHHYQDHHGRTSGPERAYASHSLASSASHLSRLPMVPMMIDDDDDNDTCGRGGVGGDDDYENDEQAVEIDLDLTDGDDNTNLALNHHQHLHHLQHFGHHYDDNNGDHHHHQLNHQGHRSLRLIDGLRQQHETRYKSGGHRHPSDKLSLANSIMLPGQSAHVAPHNRHLNRDHHHHQQHHLEQLEHHFSLPPLANTATALLANSNVVGDCGDSDCAAIGADSDVSNSSTAQFHSHHHHHHHHHRQQQLADLSYNQAGRPHLARFGAGAKSNSHLTTYPQQNLAAAIYYQPQSLIASELHQRHLNQNHHHQLKTPPDDGRSRLLASSHLQSRGSGSFLQISKPKAKPPPLPVPQDKPQVFIAPRPSAKSNNNNNNSIVYQNARASSNKQPNFNYPTKASYNNDNNNNNNHNSDIFRLVSSTSIDTTPAANHQMTNRMHPPAHTKAAAAAAASSTQASSIRHYQQQPAHHTSNNQLAAPEASDPSHGNKHQQVRRSRSSQQLGGAPSPIRSGSALGKSGSGRMMNGPALVAASQINANLAAISLSGGNGGGGNGRRDLRGLARTSDLRQPLVLGCCGKLAKFLLFIANVLFWSAGIALGAWGILALVDDHKYNLSQLLVFDSNTRMSLFQLLSWSFITLGCATILVGVCGCSAMFKNSRWILGLYIFLILAIFALDLATGLLAMIFQERLVANVRLQLVNKLRNEYGLQASFTAAIDYIQTKYECCGLDGHFDYDQSLWRLQRLGGFEATVARTCCHLRNTFDDQAHVNPRPVNESMCQSTDVRFHQSYRYRRGCLDDLERLIRYKIWTFTIGCGIVGGIILLSLALATCFCRSIPTADKSFSGKKSSNGSASRKSSSRVHQQALDYAENVAKKQGQHHHVPSSHYR